MMLPNFSYWVKLFRLLKGERGHPSQRPDYLQGDRGYDSEPHRNALRKLGILPLLANRRIEHGSGLGVYHWLVERTFSWLYQCRTNKPLDNALYRGQDCGRTLSLSLRFLVCLAR